jgi:uncharacterized protein HemY
VAAVDVISSLVVVVVVVVVVVLLLLLLLLHECFLNSKRASEPVSSQNFAQSMTICSSTRSSSAGVSVASL